MKSSEKEVQQKWLERIRTNSLESHGFEKVYNNKNYRKQLVEHFMKKTSLSQQKSILLQHKRLT